MSHISTDIFLCHVLKVLLYSMSQDIFDAHFLKLLYAHKYMYLWVQTMLIQYVYYENKSEKFPFETPPLSCRFCEFSRVKNDNVSVKIS